MLRKQTPALSNTYSVAESDIQVQRLSTRTAIRAGKVECYADTQEAAKACCDAKENIKNRAVHYSGRGNTYYCEYSDVGTGDWD